MNQIAMDYIIEPMVDGDWPFVLEIYVEGLATGQATFETSPPSWEDWDAGHLKSCRLVAKIGGRVSAWAALSPVSRRPAYSGVTEVSIYVAESSRGAGVGKGLLAALAAESESAGIWTLQASIFPENPSSIAIHEACGFRMLGQRERISRLNGVWRDTVIMERRSRVVGVDEAQA